MISPSTRRIGHLAELEHQLTFLGDARPDSLVISCTDANLDLSAVPELERTSVLLLRTPGNAVSAGRHADGLAAAIQWACDVARVRHLVICGHSLCSADPAPDPTEELLDLWDSPPPGSLEAGWKRLTDGARRVHHRTVAAQRRVIDELERLGSLPWIRVRAARRILGLYGLFYSHEGGRFLRYEPEVGDFAPLGQS